MKKTLAVLVAAVLVATALCASLTVSAAPTNVAKGKVYVLSQLFKQAEKEDGSWGWEDSAPISYPDTGNAELTDGIFPTDGGIYDAAYFGFHAECPDVMENGYAYANVDLAGVYDLSQLVLYVGSGGLGGGIGTPDKVEFWVSEDTTNFTLAGTVEPVNDDSKEYIPVTLDCSVTARYIQVHIFRAWGWMFITEFEAYGEPASGNAGSGTTSTPSESKPADSGKPATGDTGVVVFTVLGIAAVAGTCVAVKKRRKAV